MQLKVSKHSAFRRPRTSIYHTLVRCHRFVLQVSVYNCKSDCSANKAKPRRQFNFGGK